MSRAVFDLCCFGEIVFDYETPVSPDITATRLYIKVDRKSLLAVVLLKKAGLEIIAGKRDEMDVSLDYKTDMMVDNGSKSSLDFELIGGGN